MRSKKHCAATIKLKIIYKFKKQCLKIIFGVGVRVVKETVLSTVAHKSARVRTPSHA